MENIEKELTADKQFGKLSRLNNIKLLIATLIVNIIIAIAFAWVSRYFDYPIHKNFMPFDSLEEELLMILILAPVLETALYQYAIIEVVLSLTKWIFKKEIIFAAVLIAAIAFGLSHLYNYLYMILTAAAGFTLGLFYVIVRSRKSNAFVYTMILHALYNLFVFTMKHLF